jgi:phage terminase large subunit-like protein
MIALLEEKKKRERKFRYKKQFNILYDWQKEFIQKTSEYTEVCLCAANRIGKTFTGTYIDAIHAMGDYPDDWQGHKFSHAPLIWCLGYSGEKTRDLLQAEILGRKTDDGFEGGLIPSERIHSWESMTGTPGAMRTVRVKHSSGNLSTIQFWSYSQGQHALMGDSVDWAHIDEEPKDQSIHPQVITRTATGNKGKGGKVILTFTPENGRTDLVIKFMDSPGKGQYFMQKGWDDAPHLNDDVKEKLLDSYPAHQRDMQTKGVPMLGHGRIYDFGEDFITCEPFEIPAHFRVIDGMDFGWDHPQARVRLAFNPETGDHYITHAWKQSKCTPSEAWGATKSWADKVPTAWPHDGLNSEKSSGEQQKKAYIDAGFVLHNERATWPDGGNGVEAGIFEIRDLMSKGKFKVFSGLRSILDEILQYHRDDRGKIVKAQDDALDAMRYAYMMKRFAIAFGDILKDEPQVRMPRPIRAKGRR